MNKNSGFTLIEVLIAMLVMGVGLLGFAGLQATSIKKNQSAYGRSQATQLAYDLADRMRANVAGATAGAYSGVAALKPNCRTIVGCTPADMAANDLYEWNCALLGCPNAVPPIPSTISNATLQPIPLPVAGVYTITIVWDDDHDQNVKTPDVSFAMSFQL